MRIRSVGGDFPKLGSLFCGIPKREAETASIGRPAQPEGKAGCGEKRVLISPVRSHHDQLIAGRNEKTVSVRHPGRVVCQYVRNAVRITA